MLYAKIKDTNNGITTDNLFFSFSDLFTATFSPDLVTVSIIPFKVSGKNYTERKENLADLAKEFSGACEGGFSWQEETTVLSWFETMGARYGLIKEFRENGII